MTHLGLGARLAAPLALLFGWLLPPLTQSASPPPAPTAVVSRHPDAAGIDWFAGDVGGAFDAAQAARKPVFLYWGARWCPPCQQLKSSVFSRSDFMQKSKQFVAVYLDGDDPGAQKWGEKFHVVGYPTVVILRPDGKELTRISGGMDLSLYADLLDIALGDVKPMSAVIAAAKRAPAALTHNDCQRLAYNAWEVGEFSAAGRKALAMTLLSSGHACSSLTPAERARLIVNSVLLAPLPDSVTQVIDVVEDPAVAPLLADALEGLDADFYKAVKARGASVSAEFERAWSRTMDHVADDPAVIDADQLAAVGTQLALAKQFAPDGKVPLNLAAAARAKVSRALAKKADPYVRAGTVNSASFVYEQLDDLDAEYAMLEAELAVSKTPYYYMSDLGDVEEKRGHVTVALAWYERAYRESQGIATRFQWGGNYLSALLRLTPADTARIQSVGSAVIAELDGPERIQARARLELEKLDARLREWNSKRHHDADLRNLRAQMQRVCGKLPNADAGIGACRKFLRGAVATAQAAVSSV
jgi:thiol-disulfide isomerase/thioredoxin